MPIPQLLNELHAHEFYVAGSHAFKAGVTLEQGVSNVGRNNNGDVDYDFLRGRLAGATLEQLRPTDG